MTPQSILDKAYALLQGEPARFIGYGSAIALVGLVALANALGITRFGEGLSLTDALIGTTAAIVTVGGIVENIRRFVYSKPSVEVIAENAAITGDSTVPPPPATDVAAGGDTT